MDEYKAERIVTLRGEQVKIIVTITDTPEVTVANKPKEAKRLLRNMARLLKDISNFTK
jgi:hypothetical protein